MYLSMQKDSHVILEYKYKYTSWSKPYLTNINRYVYTTSILIEQAPWKKTGGYVSNQNRVR